MDRMKKILDLEKKAILFIVLLLMPIAVNADKVEIDGINYELNESDHTASVTSRKNKYTGDIVIPTTVVYKEITYNVSSIGNYAFSGCPGLTEIIIPNSITDIGASAFQECISLTSITIPNSVTTISAYVFKGCTRLASISIPNSVTLIGESAFEGCIGFPVVDNIRYADAYAIEVIDRSLTTYNIKEGTRFIGSYAFNGCTGLSNIKIPNSVTSIGHDAFAGCTALTSVYISDITAWCNIHFYEDDAGSAGYYCSNPLSYAHHLFLNDNEVNELVIPNGVTKINNSVFWGCHGLTSIVIPSSVRTVGKGAFGECKNLIKMTFEDGDTEIGISERNFDASLSLSSIYLGRNMSTWSSFFYSLQSISDVTISKTVSYLAGSILNKCKIKTITFEEGSDTLTLENYGLPQYSTQQQPFEKITIDSVYMGRIIVHKNRSTQSTKNPFTRTESSFSMRIGHNIKEIGDNVFSDWKIDTLYIPKNVEKIGSSPFQSCSYLNDVFIDDGESVLEFSEGIGFYGSQLRNLYLGRNISYPEGCSPFKRNKEGLKSLTIGNYVTEICESQFAGCVNLNQLAFPASLKKIGEQAFYGCEGLDTLNIPANISEIGKDAFNLCRGLTFVNLEDSDEPLTIDNNFMNCELKKVYFGRNVIYPDHSSPFSSLEYLDSLIIGSKVTAIGNAAFADCSNLQDVVSYSEMVPETEQYAFTQSYLPSASLLVPYKLYDQYCTTTPWSLFGRIKNFEGLYNLIYVVDGEVYKKDVVKQGTAIVAEDAPTKEGYTFSGWSSIPETMPANDVTITGSFTVNKYKVTYIIDGEVFATDFVEYGATIVPPIVSEKEGFTFDGWSDIPETMPAHDITIYGSYTSGIAEIKMDSANVRIYNINGKRINKLQRGINIIIGKDGKVRKVNIK